MTIENVDPIEISKNVTLELNRHTLSKSTENALLRILGSDVAITNSTVKSTCVSKSADAVVVGKLRPHRRKADARGQGHPGEQRRRWICRCPWLWADHFCGKRSCRGRRHIYQRRLHRGNADHVRRRRRSAEIGYARRYQSGGPVRRFLSRGIFKGGRISTTSPCWRRAMPTRRTAHCSSRRRWTRMPS